MFFLNQNFLPSFLKVAGKLVFSVDFLQFTTHCNYSLINGWRNGHIPKATWSYICSLWQWNCLIIIVLVQHLFSSSDVLGRFCYWYIQNCQITSNYEHSVKSPMQLKVCIQIKWKFPWLENTEVFSSPKTFLESFASGLSCANIH